MTTFVLVPGAWLGGWVWSRVSPLLETEGEVYPVTLTGMGERMHLGSKDVGIETAIQDVLNVMAYNDLEDVVLVGHSFAGKLVAAVADRAPNKVSAIVYVDAFRPRKNFRGPQASFPKEFPEDDWKIPFPRAILGAAGKDIQGEDLSWLLSKVTPIPSRYFYDPVTLSAKFDSVRSGYVLCTGGGDPVDEIIAGKWGKLDGPYKVIDSGHWPMITRPEELVDDITFVAGLG